MMSHMNYIKNQVGIEFSHYTATFFFPSPLFNIFRAESKKIFVGGLPTEVTEKEFADYFGTFGLVKVGWATGDICDSSLPLIPSLDWSGVSFQNSFYLMSFFYLNPLNEFNDEYPLFDSISY